VALLLVRLLLAAVLFLAAVGKVGEPAALAGIRAFVGELGVPDRAAAAATAALPGIEWLLASLLVLGITTRAQGWLGVILIGTFTLALTLGWLLGVPLEVCACFGRGVFAGYGGAIGKNVVLLGLLLAVARRGGGRYSLDGLFARRERRSPLLAVTVILPAVILSLFCMNAVVAARRVGKDWTLTGRVTGPDRAPLPGSEVFDDTGRLLGRADRRGGFVVPWNRSRMGGWIRPPKGERELSTREFRIPGLRLAGPGARVSFRIEVQLPPSAGPGETAAVSTGAGSD
jgi:uncharacterized membrane protein YphA (DoxX/SURF4 family)